ncbi:hypothetical protein ANCDUO_05739 [Ancylostoma duodenale]|uniref:Uncharacterized protein n=1 Tax=Ancylostoma duodenale TaxID=51022 RepID=A0A0C2DMV7_9BILA|nr:hypothetical protein ANCDUO_05739 [Ancylostoma duodenale]
MAISIGVKIRRRVKHGLDLQDPLEILMAGIGWMTRRRTSSTGGQPNQTTGIKTRNAIYTEFEPRLNTWNDNACNMLHRAWVCKKHKSCKR